MATDEHADAQPFRRSELRDYACFENGDSAARSRWPEPLSRTPMVPQSKKSKTLLLLLVFSIGILFSTRHHDPSNRASQTVVVPQPIFGYAHNWAVDTPLGTFGYVEILFKSPSILDRRKTDRAFILGHRGFETSMSPESVAVCALLLGVGVAATLGYVAFTFLMVNASNENTA